MTSSALPDGVPSTGTVRRDTLALVIPLYNEEEVLPLLIREIEAFRAQHPEVVQVILVDDGSKDQTATLARTLLQDTEGYLLLEFSRNFGHQMAITAGLHWATTDGVVVMDGDLQHPLSTIPEMIEKWKAGYDVVYGVREYTGGETAFKRVTARLFYRFFRWATDIDIPIDAGDFRLLSRHVVAAYCQLTEQQPFVRGLIAWLGYNQIAVSYEQPARAAGSTKYHLKKMIRFATVSLTSFSDKPLRMAMKLGALVALFAIVGLVRVLVVKLIFQTTVAGWASLMLSIFLFSGIILLSLGIIGTYLARVYEEVKGRPRYLLKQVWRANDAPILPAPGWGTHDIEGLQAQLAALQSENRQLRERLLTADKETETVR